MRHAAINPVLLGLRHVLMLSAWAVSALSQAVELNNPDSAFPVSVNGYAKLDMILDLDGHRDKYQFLARGIPVRGDSDYEQDGYFSMHGKESRVALEVQRNNDAGSLQKVLIEFDFFDETSTSPRLRHFAFFVDDFIVGKYWTNATDLQSIPYFIDFAYGEALYGGRKYQLRWQPMIGKKTQLGLSIEEPSDSNIDNPLGFAGKENPQMPVFSVRLTHELEQGHLAIATELTELHWDGGGVGPDDSALSWVATFSGSWRFWKPGILRWTATYGDGSAKGVIALASEGSGATLDADGKLDTDRATTLALSYTHDIMKVLSATFGYATLNVDPSAERSGQDLQDSAIAHANLLWRLNGHIDTGVEYIWGKSRNIDDREGINRRIQAMIRYTF